jgi:hypothetical protein
LEVIAVLATVTMLAAQGLLENLPCMQALKGRQACACKIKSNASTSNVCYVCKHTGKSYKQCTHRLPILKTSQSVQASKDKHCNH